MQQLELKESFGAEAIETACAFANAHGGFIVIGVEIVAVGYAAQPANTSWPCRSWIDPVLHVKFPERLGGLEMTSRRIYNSGDDDYSLRYDSAESRAVESGGKHLDVTTIPLT